MEWTPQAARPQLLVARCLRAFGYARAGTGSRGPNQGRR